MARHNDLGKWGEQLAMEKLSEEGFSIIETNYKQGNLEIDIIGRRNHELVFAEVKTRSDMEDDPLEAVTKRKIMNMVRVADAYLRAQSVDYHVRFDLFAINGTPEDYRMEHIPDAFEPPLTTFR